MSDVLDKITTYKFNESIEINEAPMPIVEVALDRSGVSTSFSDAQQLAQWIENERQYWNFIQACATTRGPNFDPALIHIWTPMEQCWTRLQNLANQLVAHPEDPTAIASITASLNENYVQQVKCIASSSAEGKFVLALAKSDPVAAAYSVAHLIKSTAIEFKNRRAVEGVVFATLFREDIKNSASAEREVLEELILKQETRSAAYESVLQKLRTDFVETKKQIIETHNKQEAEHAELVTNISSVFKNLQETYEQRLAIEAPVQYWGNVQRLQWLGAAITAVVLILGGIVGLKYLNSSFAELLSTANPETWRIWHATARALAIGWGVVLVSKFLMSRLHLATEAGLRRVMVHSYLAMMKDGHVFKEEDRHLILNPLFQMPETGLMKNSVMPPHTAKIQTFIDRNLGS